MRERWLRRNMLGFMNPENPIEEIWRIREAMSAAEGYDAHRLFEQLRREEKQFGGFIE